MTLSRTSAAQPLHRAPRVLTTARVMQEGAAGKLTPASLPSPRRWCLVEPLVQAPLPAAGLWPATASGSAATHGWAPRGSSGSSGQRRGATSCPSPRWDAHPWAARGARGCNPLGETLRRGAGSPRRTGAPVPAPPCQTPADPRSGARMSPRTPRTRASLGWGKRPVAKASWKINNFS